MEKEAQIRSQINSPSQAVFTGQSQTDEMKVGTLLQIAQLGSLSIDNPPPSDTPKSNLPKQITAINYLKREEFYKTNRRPEFSHVVNLKGDDFPECSDYFRKDNPLFIGRETQLKNLYDEIVSTGHHIIVGTPGIGKTTLALAYVHSYGTDKELYPGGVFWFELNKPEPSPEAISRRFAKHFSIHGEKEDILLSQLDEVINKSHAEGKRILFVFNETENYGNLKKYTQLLRGTHHHLIITSIYSVWGTYKSEPLQLENFSDAESIQFVKRHLSKEPDPTECEILIKKCDQFPQLLRKIICHINESYDGSLQDYLKEQNSNTEDQLLRSVELTPKKLPKTSSKKDINESTQCPDIHEHELAVTLINILAKHPPPVFELLAIGVFLNSNSIAKELFPKNEKLLDEPVETLCKISLLEKVGKDHYKIAYGIRNAVKTILERNRSHLTKNSKHKVIKIEEAFSKALTIIEPKLPSIHVQNCAYDYRKYEAYIPHALALARAANRYQDKFDDIKKALFRVANLLLYSAYAYFRQGLLSEAEGMAKNGLDLAEKHYRENTKGMIIYYRLYGRILSKQNKLDAAEPILQQAIKVNLNNCSVKELPQYKLERDIAHGYLGVLLTNKGAAYYEQAETHLQIAEQALAQSLSNPELNTARLYYLALTKRHWGEYLSAKGEFFEAINMYEDALETCFEYFCLVTKSIKNNSHTGQKYPFAISIERRMATIYYSLGKYNEAEKKLNTVISILTELHGPEHEEIIASTVTLAKILFWRGSYKEAQEKFDTILNSHFAKVKPLSQPVINAIYYQAHLLAASGHYREAREKFVEALKKLQEYYTSSNIRSEREINLSKPNTEVIKALETLGFNDYQRKIQLETAKIIHHIGFIHYKLREYGIAKHFYEEANIINEKIRAKHPKAFLSDLGLASITLQQGKYQETESLLVDLLARQKKFYAENKNTQHFEIGNTHRCLAKLYTKTAQFQKATEHIDAANKIWEELKQKENCTLPEMILTQTTQAYLAWYAEHDYPKAEKLFRAALEEQEKLYNHQPHPNIAQTKIRLGRIRYYRGYYLESSQLYWEAEQILQTCFSEDERKSHPMIATLSYYIGEIYYQCWVYLDKYSINSSYLTKAKALFDEAQTIFGDNHPEAVPILCALSKIAIGTKAGGTAYERLMKGKVILEKTFEDKAVLEKHPLYAMVLGNMSEISDWDNSNSDTNSQLKDGLKTVTILEDIYQKPSKMHPLIIEFLGNLCLLENNSIQLCAKMITYFYEWYFGIQIDTDEAKEYFLNDFQNRNIEKITDIGLLIDLQRILNCFRSNEGPISELNDRVHTCIISNFKLAQASPLFTEKKQQYIYIECDSNEKIPKNYLLAAKNLGIFLTENDCGLIHKPNNSSLMQAVINGVSESNGKIICIEEHPIDKTPIMSSTAGIIFLPGGLNTLHKLTEILMNIPSLNKLTKPIGVFNIEKFYDGFLLTLKQSIDYSNTNFNYLDLVSPSHNPLTPIKFFEDPSKLINYIIGFKPSKIDPKKYWFQSTNKREERQTSAILQAKLSNTDSPIFLKEDTIDQNPDYLFTLLGTTREQVKNKLLTQKDDPKARELLSEEICSALITGKMFIDDSSGSVLQTKHSQAQKELDLSFQKINASFPAAAAQNVDQLINWLESQNYNAGPEELDLRSKRSVADETRTQLNAYCQRSDIFQTYVEELGKQLSLGYKSALLYAQLANISLYIWQKDSNQSEQLVLLTKHETSKSQNVIHILLIDGFTHFNHLSPVDPPVASNDGGIVFEGTKTPAITTTTAHNEINTQFKQLITDKLARGYEFKLSRLNSKQLLIGCTPPNRTNAKAVTSTLNKLQKILGECLQANRLKVNLTEDEKAEQDTLCIESENSSILNKVTQLFKKVADVHLNKSSIPKRFFKWTDPDQQAEKQDAEISAVCKLQ